MQCLAASGENTDVGPAVQQCIGEACARGHEMLAVVENEEQLVLLEVLAKRLRKRFAGLFAQAQRLCGCIRNQRWILDRSKVHEPDAVRIFLENVCADL